MKMMVLAMVPCSGNLSEWFAEALFLSVALFTLFRRKAVVEII